MVKTKHNIELHIEELMLDGFAPGDRFAIAKTVERELTRLLTERGVPSSVMLDHETARIDAGAFHVAAASPADTIGSQVARAVYTGLE